MEQGASCPYPACGCVGYAYVPPQELGEIFNADKGLENGTIFPELALTIDEYGKICHQCGGGMNE